MEVCADVKSSLVFFFVFCLLFSASCSEDDSDSFVYDSGTKTAQNFAQAKPMAMRYLLYEVNPGEGFNLRRDVYMRIANLVNHLNKRQPWTLVLPPWGNLYHWRSAVEQSSVPWGTFFDLHSLSLHVPVMEFKDFVDVLGDEKKIDEVYYLQMYEEGWTNGRWGQKMDERPCIEETHFNKDSSGRWRWHYWGYNDVYSEDFKCISIQQEATQLVKFLTQNTTARSVFLVRAEEVIHGKYSEWSSLFWTARRSLVFAKHLRDIGDEFRRSELDSTDKKDGTVLGTDWTKMKKQHGDATGGPYLAVHLRRQDFARSSYKDVPSLKEAAAQIQTVLNKLSLDTVFVATDAPNKEYKELSGYLPDYHVKRYVPTKDVLHQYKDGGVAIIDQWICAHARYFMGTAISTFSFRINEEREILGFNPETTFNSFCGSGKSTCEKPSKWTVQYE